ncbi:glucose 1-dehydrogenase [Bacillus sp. EB600]|uniref:SDR family NAD(P)-dependent oxidoreductase n=1 Tax=Bacillus sp. EB600 TaxID=2806345 RepID=UPI0021092E11|nr:glucose 1-dehydrogenase [Bacillus sp. EB600]MCQ6279935.1 glucose 1-dehydrogenase [Bacillus sp. EB600]
MNIPQYDLKGKNAIVTGGTKGIGYAMAYTLAHYGANVIITGRNTQDGENASKELRSLGPNVKYIPCDVTKKDQIGQMINEAIQEFGTIDILVNNAGMNKRQMIHDVEEETWDQIINTNLKGYFLTGQLVSKHMMERKTGVIINVSSILGSVGIPYMSSYAASKGGVDQLTRVWAHELGPFNIRVNALAPGFLNKSMSGGWLSEPKTKQTLIDSTMLGRLGELEDLAGPTLFLASDMSSYVTGHVLYVEGGWVAR